MCLYDFMALSRETLKAGTCTYSRLCDFITLNANECSLSVGDLAVLVRTLNEHAPHTVVLLAGMSYRNAPCLL